uniref:paired immunoglobulin-like type 2 receptor beta n=1 Tax=Euleptes europaea TaxID=460621 RepID=UPI00254156CB|nr:paired immunoglobulin-like type 2 receptor beta [Euleptes europaea]
MGAKARAGAQNGHRGRFTHILATFPAEVLVPVEEKSPEQKPQPAKSIWSLKECPEVPMMQACVCQVDYQICQPLQLSARLNGSVTLPCRFTHRPGWVEPKAAQVHWRLGSFHSMRYLFNCCMSRSHTDPEFEGRVSLAREEGQPYTAAIRITDLREADSGLYFCRVSVGGKAWQTINGTNLTVIAAPQQPEGGNTTPLPQGFLAGVSTGAVLLAAAIILGLAMLLLTWRKGHCQKRTPSRRIASGGQEEKEAGCQELHCRGARGPPLEEPPSQPPPVHPRAPGEPGLVYATLRLHHTPGKLGGSAAEETTYAAVRG